MKYNMLLLITLMLLQQQYTIQYLNGLSNFYPGYLNSVNLQRIYNCTQNNVPVQKTALAQKVDETVKDYQPLEVKKYVPFQPNNASSTNNKSIENLPANLYQFIRTMIPSHVLANHNLSNLKTTLEKYNNGVDEKVSFNTLIQLQLKEPSVFNLLTAPKHFVVTNLKNIMKYANRTMPNPPCTTTTACNAAAMPTKDTGVADNNITSQSTAQNIMHGTTAPNINNEILVTNNSAENISIMLPDMAEVENPNNVIDNSSVTASESTMVVAKIGQLDQNAESTVQHDYKPEMGQLEINDRPRFETDYQHNPIENNFNINPTQLTPTVSVENNEPNSQTDAPPDVKADDFAGYNDISPTISDTSASIVEPETVTTPSDQVDNSIRGMAQLDKNIGLINTLDENTEPETDTTPSAAKCLVDNNIRGMGQLDKNIGPINTLDENTNISTQLNPNSPNVDNLKGERSTVIILDETEPPPAIPDNSEDAAYLTTDIPLIDIRFEDEAVTVDDITEQNWPESENYATLSVAEIPGATNAYTFVIEEISEASVPTDMSFTINSDNIEHNWPTTYPTSTEGLYNIINDATDLPQAFTVTATTAANDIENNNENINVAPPKEEAFIDLGESFTEKSVEKNYTVVPPPASTEIYYETDIMPEDIKDI